MTAQGSNRFYDAGTPPRAAHGFGPVSNAFLYDDFMPGLWTKIPVIVAVVGAIVSILALAYQIWRSRFVLSIDLLLKFEADFFGPGKRELRSKAASGMLREPPDFSETEAVLDFFETIALLVKKRALDVYMVWHTFDYWISRYDEAASSYIRDRQQREPQVWKDLNGLVQALRKLEAKEARRSGASPPVLIPPDEIRRFLEEESKEGTSHAQSAV